MESTSSSLDDYLILTTERTVSNYVLRAFRKLERIPHSLDGKIDDASFWLEIPELVYRVGPVPVLLISRASEDRTLRRFIYSVSPTPENIVIDTNPPTERSGSFIASINGILVFGSDLEPGQAWLFSSNLLHTVRYAELDQKQSCVEISHEVNDEMQVTVKVRARQFLKWADYPIFQIHMPDPE